MPRRSSPAPKSSVFPPNDATTYRDLLLFEERLKTTAANLQRRKSRYQLFLFQLLLVIAFLLAEVLLPPQTSLLAIPYKMLMQWLLPELYTPETEVVLHPYFASGLLFVSVTTLVLFFASGMYSEKIAYANKYVPHANKALRSFNMYLNVRKPKFYRNPLAFFFPRQSFQSSSSTPSVQTFSGPRPIAPIPPANNPRGELIFSSRVDRHFKDNYERYRATFEKKREEKLSLERRARWGWLLFWRKAPPPQPPTQAKPPRPLSRAGTPPKEGAPMRQRTRSGSPKLGTDSNPPSPGGSSRGQSSLEFAAMKERHRQRSLSPQR